MVNDINVLNQQYFYEWIRRWSVINDKTNKYENKDV
jgi:hypothetical protein